MTRRISNLKPDFKLAYTKANTILVKNGVINSFPFSAKELIKETSSIRCRTYDQAKKYGVDIQVFGSESAVLFDYRGKKIMFYDDSKPGSHINYSIIHEAGHDDMGHLMDKEIDSELYKKQEIEANYYAAQILMPEQVLRYAQQKGIIINSPFLIKNFGVSAAAAEKRINTLAKTKAEWYSREENEYDDIILSRYLPMIQHLIPHDLYDYEDEYNRQLERDRWNSYR